MKKNQNNISNKIYWILSILMILFSFISLLLEIINHKTEYLLCYILTLSITILLHFSKNLLKVTIPSILKIFILLFIFSSEILGQVYNFYGLFKFFDNYVHILNGFICTSIGLYLVLLLKEKKKYQKNKIKLILLIAFCFSMTMEVLWEFYEYTSDNIFKKDMQRDQYINEIHSSFLDTNNKRNVISIKNIKYVILYDENGIILNKMNGYLDIGLNDTMQDLFDNAIGSVIFCICGYIYMSNNHKYQFIENFIIKKENQH